MWSWIRIQSPAGWCMTNCKPCWKILCDSNGGAVSLSSSACEWFALSDNLSWGWAFPRLPKWRTNGWNPYGVVGSKQWRIKEQNPCLYMFLQHMVNFLYICIIQIIDKWKKSLLFLTCVTVNLSVKANKSVFRLWRDGWESWSLVQYGADGPLLSSMFVVLTTCF